MRSPRTSWGRRWPAQALGGLQARALRSTSSGRCGVGPARRAHRPGPRRRRREVLSGDARRALGPWPVGLPAAAGPVRGGEGVGRGRRGVPDRVGRSGRLVRGALIPHTLAVTTLGLVGPVTGQPGGGRDRQVRGAVAPPREDWRQTTVRWTDRAGRSPTSRPADGRRRRRPDRENEGDLIFAAEQGDPELMGFMIRYTSGVVCVPMRARCSTGCTPAMMTPHNRDRMRTAYTVSASTPGTGTTGISARPGRTVRVLATRRPSRTTRRRPGHVFPLRYHGRRGAACAPGTPRQRSTSPGLAGLTPGRRDLRDRQRRRFDGPRARSCASSPTSTTW
jgi:hypothetical protein